MEDAFMDFLFEVFCDGDYPTLTAINDLLWFDDIYIFESLGITPMKMMMIMKMKKMTR